MSKTIDHPAKIKEFASSTQNSLNMVKKLLMIVYLLGYQQWIAPKILRRLLCGSAVHRAWLAGNLGIFFEDHQRSSVCDRQWYTNRS